MAEEFIYVDHNATTPLDPRVLDAMLPWLRGTHGNPSSVHRLGQAAREAVERAREQVAELLSARPPEIVFTASGTEANNSVIAGIAEQTRSEARNGGRILLSALEHPSVRKAAEREAERDFGQGMSLDWLPLDSGPPAARGRVSVEAVAEHLHDDTRLVCLMLANNEIGTLQPVREVAALCRERGIPLLCDAVQAVGKLPVDVGELDADFVVLGGHKLYGPLGAAALWVRSGHDLPSYLVGGSQERRRRAGTPDLPALVGLGAAAELARKELSDRETRMAALRDRFEAGLHEIEGTRVHGSEVPRLPNTSHVAFDDVEGQALMIRLDLAGFAVSTGSACSSGTVTPSAALLAMGIGAQEALSSLRVSFGITNTEAEVDAFLAALADAVAALRSVRRSGETRAIPAVQRA